MAQDEQPYGIQQPDDQAARDRCAQTISEPLARTSGWMKFLAVLTIISSVVSVLVTAWNLLIVWLPVWSAVVLYMAAGSATEASQTSSEGHLLQAMRHLRTYFLIAGVSALVGLVLSLLALFGVMAVTV